MTPIYSISSVPWCGLSFRWDSVLASFERVTSLVKTCWCDDDRVFSLLSIAAASRKQWRRFLGSGKYARLPTQEPIEGICRLTGYWVSTPEGVRLKVSNQGGSINYFLIATLSLCAKREGSYVRRASSVQAILNCSCAVN
jgi:hypothetical protein